MTELETHELIRDALNAGSRNPNFFVWLNVAVEDPVETPTYSTRKTSYGAQARRLAPAYL